MKIKLRKTGEIVKVKGDAPEKPGDHFVGVDTQAPAPKVPEKPKKPKAKSRLVETKEGRAFVCVRGGKADSGPPPLRERSFRYDPKLHEKMKG